MATKKYENDEDRRAARLETFKKSNKAYMRKLAPDFVRRSHILPNELATQLDAYCDRTGHNTSLVVTDALKTYLKIESEKKSKSHE